eukprot:2914057-Pleurochrysis_carterae.AAC.1
MLLVLGVRRRRDAEQHGLREHCQDHVLQLPVAHPVVHTDVAAPAKLSKADMHAAFWIWGKMDIAHAHPSPRTSVLEGLGGCGLALRKLVVKG